MERKKENRSLLVYIALTLVTCGIYGLIFYWNLFKDLNDVCRVRETNDSEQSPNYLIYILLTLVTCGIYGWFWLYKQGNRIQRVGEDYGIRIEENGTTLLMWNLLGALLCGAGIFVAQYYLFENINKLCICYNKEYVEGGGGYPDPPVYDEYASYEQEKSDSGYSYDSRYRAIGDGGYRQTRSTVQETVGVLSGLLVCTRGTMNGARIPMQDLEMLLIGRDSSVCNLVLPDMDISRRHCTVQFNAGKNCYYVTDYSSTGTYLDGSLRLEKDTLTQCERGSRLLLGNGSNEFLLQ